MLVRRVSPAVHDLACFGQGAFLPEPDVRIVQFIEVGCDLDSFGVEPGPLPDPVARVDGCLAVHGRRTQVGPPGLSARASSFRQRFAVGISTGKSAEVGAIARPLARDEEAHVFGCERQSQAGEHDYD